MVILADSGRLIDIDGIVTAFMRKRVLGFAFIGTSRVVAAETDTAIG